MNFRDRRLKKRGTKSEGPTVTLQNRVRDAFRKGLQWKWDRDPEPAFSGHKESHRHERADSSSQRHWPTFAPAAIQKFRRLFSTDTNNASTEQSLDTGTESSDSVVASCTRNTSEEQIREGNMVRMKTKDNKSDEKATVLEASGESPFLDRVSSLPSASASDPFDSLHQPSKKQSQGCISLSPSKMEESSDDASGNVVSNSPNMQSRVREIKASDAENISVNKNCVSSNKSNVCDLVNDKSAISIPLCDKESDALESSSNNIKEPERVKGLHFAPSDTAAICGTDNKNTNNDECVKEYCNEETLASSFLPSSSTVPSVKNELTNPSIAISTIESGKTEIHHQKKLVEPLYLNIDPASNAGAHARKSPVTVQEWVDSIPVSSHLEEDLEDANAERDSSLTAPESQIGTLCPSVTIRPASGQSGTVADQRREAFSRDASPSLQSDTGSHASSVDSYLEARRPDPEEVLLGLGFGGSLHAKEAEVSRIPARFLQPSQVKGVEIDHFLRYQQDLIETFESGYSGYRGLTGGAQIPSVIVAKIMEKLREHDRESSVKSSAGSSPGHHADISKRRFSRAAHKVTILTKMKSRDSLASSAQAHSVLNPDNRKFLDNQGSKSPEVSRKRMIIGHRSFTFDGDGQLIEAETNPEEEVQEAVVPSKPPLPRPLVHKDSELSSATSLSLTSYDSDSDTDEASGVDRIINETGGDKSNCLQNNSAFETNGNVLVSPVTVNATNGEQNTLEKRRMPSPPISDINSSLNEQAVNIENRQLGMKTSTPVKGVSWKDLHQINLAPSMPPFTAPAPDSVLWTHTEESSSSSGQHHDTNGNLREYLKQRNQSTIEKNPPELLAALRAYSKPQLPQTPPPNTRQMSFYKISDFVLPDDCTSPADTPEPQCSLPADAQQLHRMYSMPKSSSMFLDKELRRKLSLNSSVDSYVAKSVAHSPDLKNWSTSSVSSWESEKDFSHKILSHKISSDNVFEEQTVERTHLPEVNASINRRRGSLKRQKNIDVEDPSVGLPSSSNLNVNCPNIAVEQVDSFEMEEIAVEDEIRGVRIGSANSDSSGFQEETSSSKPPHRAALGKQLSQSEPLLHTHLFPEECTQVHTTENLKRLSLPVIRVQDESGLTQWHATNMCASDNTFSSSLRRAQSLPSKLSALGLKRLSESGSMTDSIGNMFSSCSDESVIHIPRTSVDVTVEGRPEFLPLPSAILDYEGEVEALRAPRECCKCNITLKSSLSKCHSDLLLSQESDGSFSQFSKCVTTIQEAQNDINNIVKQMENNSCSSSDCKMNDTLEQVASVVQQQNSLCLLLEKFSVDLMSSSKHSSAQSTFESLSSTSNAPNTQKTPRKSIIEVSSSSQHSLESCVKLCQVVEKETHRLQELVHMNVTELTRVRVLLEKLLQNGKM